MHETSSQATHTTFGQSIKALDVMWNFCRAWMWKDEDVKLEKRVPYLCCKQGMISLPRQRPTPFLEQLLSPRNRTLSQQFRDYIRSYNALFQFTSFGARIDHSINCGRGPYVFPVSSQMHHRIGSFFVTWYGLTWKVCTIIHL